LLRREIDPREIYRALFRGWYWLVLFIVGGGLLGLIFTKLRPPRYQAVAALRVDLMGEDFGHLGWPQKRDLLSPVRVLLLGDATLEQIPGMLGDMIEVRPPAEMRDQLRLNDYESEWLLGVVSTDPAQAAAIANAWAQAAVTQLEQSVEHAALASAIETELNDLGCETKGKNPAAWDCAEGAPADRVDPLIEEWGNHMTASRGIPAELTFEPIREASPPDQPIYWGRGVVILAGALLGALVGIGLSLVWMSSEA